MRETPVLTKKKFERRCEKADSHLGLMILLKDMNFWVKNKPNIEVDDFVVNMIDDGLNVLYQGEIKYIF